MKTSTLLVGFLFYAVPCIGQTFSGVLSDSETGALLENVEVRILEDNQSVLSDASGRFSLNASDDRAKTFSLEKAGYTYEEHLGFRPRTGLKLSLRKKKMSAASLRWQAYIEDASSYNSPEIPNNANWTVRFKEADLSSDLAPDSNVIRRDPSAVLKVNDLYYVWYTKGAGPSTWFNPNRSFEKVFPWDLCDIWYATSSDGWTWEEKGAAVRRGPAGSFDDRSVFTPEVLRHQGKYYLVYQAVQAPYVERVKNVVAMAVADSPDGPWTKLSQPILKPTNNGIWKPGSTSRHDVIKKGDFDSHKVHDPCLLFYRDKFHLYYKGERMGEEKFFGQREIKWGVAIADQPEGPYVKSEYNPITNTGHEVCVWPYRGGIAIIQKLDGPERGTIQFAPDGINFEIKARASHMPDAFGLYRTEDHDVAPFAGVRWGLCHAMRWDRVPGGWMYLRRFDLARIAVSGVDIVGDSIAVQNGTSRRLLARVLPFDATDKAVTWTSDKETVATVCPNGLVTARSLGTATITLASNDGGFTDSIEVTVQQAPVAFDRIIIQAEAFTKTGSAEGKKPGGYDGVNATETGIN